MRRDIFKRATRMTHKFGATDAINDPLGMQTFDFYGDQKRTRVGDLSRPGHPSTVQQHGEHELFNPPRSPVQTPSGRFASKDGPAPDYAEGVAAPVPVSTKKRVNHLKTDK